MRGELSLARSCFASAFAGHTQVAGMLSSALDAHVQLVIPVCG